jgi:cytoskeletal protein RodZ
MNWLVIAVVGAAAAWFEYNYQRSRHPKKTVAAKATSPSTTPASNASSDGAANASATPVPETAHVAEAGNSPSISPGDENDKKLNTPEGGPSGLEAYSIPAQP